MIRRTCSCTRGEHSAPLEEYVIRQGAVQELPRLLAPYESVYLVADEITYRVLGKEAERLLREVGKRVHTHVLQGSVLPDTSRIGEILLHMQDPRAESDIFAPCPRPDMIVGVGSGVINDLCRLVSYRVGLPYTIVGTAPSMDGYASAGSPILFEGTKATVKSTTPRFIVADTDVMKDAPYDMLLSGIGDMFGKYTAMLDWELARDYHGDYYCPEIAADVLRATDLCLEKGYELSERDPVCIRAIMEGFMVTGLGMAFTGNSRPASGAEHIIAHAWELASVEAGEPPHLHGLEVCEATLLVIAMYRRLYDETDDPHLRELIFPYLPAFERVETFCHRMRMPRVTQGREAVLMGIRRALSLRDRYTILFYLRDRGLFETYAVYATNSLEEA